MTWQERAVDKLTEKGSLPGVQIRMAPHGIWSCSPLQMMEGNAVGAGYLQAVLGLFTRGYELH